jgi:tetratricopeptide (TPR) repeat protein
MLAARRSVNFVPRAVVRRAAPVAALCLNLALAVACGKGVPDQAAIRLRDAGLAQLENDQPARAEAMFRQLAARVPDDPLAYADLGLSLLRQGNGAEALRWIGEALRRAPGRPDLLLLEGDALSGSGRGEEALPVYRQAAAGAPDSVEAQYALLQQVSGMAGAEAAASRDQALAALLRLRPENLLVQLRAGETAIARGERTAATAAYLRLRELLWQPSPPVAESLGAVLAALEAGTTAAARVPALRLDNLLKPTTLYQHGWRALAPLHPGVPVRRFVHEPARRDFGPPLAVRFVASPLATTPTVGAALAVGDFDGDGRPDIVRVRAGDPPRLEVRLAARGFREGAAPGPPAPGVARLLAADLDNDGRLDLLGYGADRVIFWRGRGDGTFEDATAAWGLAGAGATAAAVLDYDLDGDLDLALAGARAGGGELWRNALVPPLVPAAAGSMPAAGGVAPWQPSQLLAADLDRDGFPDLLLAGADGLRLLVNQGQGRFVDRTAARGLGGGGPVVAVASADLDGDGSPDLVLVHGDGRLAAFHGHGGSFAPWPLRGLAGGPFATVLAFDADNDGRLDLAAAGAGGVAVLGQRGEPGHAAFVPLAVAGAPHGLAALAAADLDGDGGLDLVAAGSAGLYRFENVGGNRNHWLDVGLRALVLGSSKNNFYGVGSILEVRAGAARQFGEVSGQVTHFGLGAEPAADLLRVVWTNGVPQDRLAVGGDTHVVETQLLKGSCPFLYAWNGREMAFVTDLLWAAPLGMPVRPGTWASADPAELVRVAGALPRGEAYELRVTEELWEAAYLDAVRLWVVDHPADVEVASNLRALPGSRQVPRVLASRGLRPVTAAWDGQGRLVTGRVARRDEVYASGFAPGPYQGVAAAPWSLTFDLGEAPGRPVRLQLDGWIFPADASLNLAVAQRPDLPLVPPRLEVEGPSGWRTLLPALGLPAGKTKTMVVDTPPLPPGAHRLRIVSNLWLAWDRIAWTTTPADGVPLVRARLEPARAQLRYRGFSAPLRRAPNAPHAFDYARVSRRSPWLPLPGRYTRYGDVRELLAAADDRSVVLGAGDELVLAFSARELPPPPTGWVRTVFLESHGWDKDADRNTWAGRQVEPLPFRDMSGYPFAPGETFPRTPALRAYLARWQTRKVAAPRP